MQRVGVAERPDWREKADSYGYDYHWEDKTCQKSCWLENAFYSFSSEEIDRLERATEELHKLCLLTVEHVAGSPALMQRFGIRGHMQDVVRESWRQRDLNPEFLGRFDLAFDSRSGSVKMLEYNADTPTTAIETAVMQWGWLQDISPSNDQFNSLHEAITGRFQTLNAAGRLRSSKLTFVPYPDSLEDFRHCQYYAELAQQAGLTTQIVLLKDVGLRPDGRFVDRCGDEIDVLFKIYPWEMMAKDRFSANIIGSGMQILEPAWKMVLSNKALLPLLWEMFPCCPWLLRAQWRPDGMGSFVAKPIFSRGGQNITIVKSGQVQGVTPGTYGKYPMVYQEYVELPRFDGRPVVLGSWVVGDKPAGMIVREGGPDGIVVDQSACVPHMMA